MQPEGTISGTALDEHGQPFKGVEVCTDMMGTHSRSKKARGDCPVTTDEGGQFRIDHGAMGTFGIEAIKLEDSYVAFAGTRVKGHLNTEPVGGDNVLKLGPKPDMLLPSVEDKFTGKPVITFQEILTRVGAPQPGRPSDRDQARDTSTRKISCSDNLEPGYKKWIYHDPYDPSRPAFIRLQQGEEKELFVELEPQAPGALIGS